MLWTYYLFLGTFINVTLLLFFAFEVEILLSHRLVITPTLASIIKKGAQLVKSIISPMLDSQET